MKVTGVVKCVTSTVEWFKVDDFYWFGKNDIGESCVIDETGDMFSLTDELTSFHTPFLYTFTMRNTIS